VLHAILISSSLVTLILSEGYKLWGFSLYSFLQLSLSHVRTWDYICLVWGSVSTVFPPYPRVIRSKSYRGCPKPRIVANRIYIKAQSKL
jgi:hypothetical protein